MEVLSDGNTEAEMERKLQEYFAASRTGENRVEAFCVQVYAGRSHGVHYL